MARIDKSGGEVRQEGPGGRIYAKGKSYPGSPLATSPPRGRKLPAAHGAGQRLAMRGALAVLLAEARRAYV